MMTSKLTSLPAGTYIGMSPIGDAWRARATWLAIDESDVL